MAELQRAQQAADQAWHARLAQQHTHRPKAGAGDPQRPAVRPGLAGRARGHERAGARRAHRARRARCRTGSSGRRRGHRRRRPLPDARAVGRAPALQPCRRRVRPDCRRDQRARPGQRQRAHAGAREAFRRRHRARAARAARRHHRRHRPAGRADRRQGRHGRQGPRRGGLVCRPRLCPGQDLFLLQPRPGRGRGRPCARARPARQRPCAGLLARPGLHRGRRRRDPAPELHRAELLPRREGHAQPRPLHGAGRQARAVRPGRCALPGVRRAAAPPPDRAGPDHGRARRPVSPASPPGPRRRCGPSSSASRR